MARAEDQGPPRGPEPVLVDAGRHEDQFGAAQGQRPRHFRNIDFAALSPALTVAVLGVEHRKVDAGDVLEFP